MSAIENLYGTILGRGSDPGGKAYWEGELKKMTGSGGMSEKDALAKIAGDFRRSDEFIANQKKKPDISNSITTLPIKDTGVGGGRGGAYNQTPSASEVEGYLKDDLYQGILKRDFDQGGLDYWMNAIQEGHHGDRNWQEWLKSSFFESDEHKKNLGGGGIIDGDGDGEIDKELPADGWWNQFEDADSFKKFLTGDADKDQGMGDFMKFMMLMSVMGGGRGFGGGGGYGGGSQYGYGGLNPGGVQQAYDPIANLTKMGTWFKDNFGSGSNKTDEVTMMDTHNDPAPR